MIDKTLKSRAKRYNNLYSFFLIAMTPKITEIIPKITK